MIITDILPAGLAIEKSDIKLGGSVLDQGKIKIENLTDGKTEVTIDLGNIEGYEKIEYSTRIEEGSLGLGSFKNEVILRGTGDGNGIGDGTLDSDKKADKTVTPTDNSYNKTFEGINYDTMTMDWKIAISPKRDAIKELKIIDTFPNKGLILLPGTLKVTLGNKPLVEGTDYTLTKNTEGEVTGYQKGFIIDFDNFFKDNEDGDPGKLLNDDIVIIYTTSYDPKEGIDPNTDNDKSKTYINTAKFEGKTKNGHNLRNPKPASKDVIDSSWNSGYKIGRLKSINSDGDLVDEWHSGNERRVQWEIYTNYLKQNLGSNVTVTDEMNYSGKIYDIEIKKYTVDEKTGETRIVEPALSHDLYEITEKSREGFKLTFKKEVEERYVIIFNTDVPEISKGGKEAEAYKNKATLNGKKNIYEYGASIGFKDANKHVSKESIGGDAVVDQELNWKIKINESLSVINKGTTEEGKVKYVTVVDTLSEGLAYKPGSLKVVRLDGSTKTEVKAGSYYTLETKEFENNTTELKIIFKDSIKSAYEIDYTTIVTAKQGEKVNNKVEYMGSNLEVISKETEKLEAQKYVWTGGGNNPALGLIKIIKQDWTGNNIRDNPATFGVEYSLSENSTRYPFGDGKFTTNLNGELEIPNLPLNRFYHIKEIEAPGGYALSDEVITKEVNTAYDGKEVNIISVPFKNAKEIDITGKRYGKVDQKKNQL